MNCQVFDNFKRGIISLVGAGTLTLSSCLSCTHQVLKLDQNKWFSFLVGRFLSLLFKNKVFCLATSFDTSQLFIFLGKTKELLLAQNERCNKTGCKSVSKQWYHCRGWQRMVCDGIKIYCKMFFYGNCFFSFLWPPSLFMCWCPHLST